MIVLVSIVTTARCGSSGREYSIAACCVNAASTMIPLIYPILPGARRCSSFPALSVSYRFEHLAREHLAHSPIAAMLTYNFIQNPDTKYRHRREPADTIAILYTNIRIPFPVPPLISPPYSRIRSHPTLSKLTPACPPSPTPPSQLYKAPSPAMGAPHSQSFS